MKAVFVGLFAAGSLLAQAGDTTRLIDSIQGPALFKAYCAVCHGPAGKGDGLVSKSQAPDLTRVATRNGGVFPSALVRRIISGEQAPSKNHGNRGMPVWGPIFSEVGRDQDLGRVRVDNLARYLEEIQAK